MLLGDYNYIVTDSHAISDLSDDSGSNFRSPEALRDLFPRAWVTVRAEMATATAAAA